MNDKDKIRLLKSALVFLQEKKESYDATFIALRETIKLMESGNQPPEDPIVSVRAVCSAFNISFVDVERHAKEMANDWK